MQKNNYNKISGLTLVEILIAIVISAIMMVAMYTSYNLVNNSYGQVTDRAKISQAGRDVVGMIIKDIRIAGFRYFGDTIAAADDHLPIHIIPSNSDRCCDQINIVYGDYDLSIANPSDRFIRYQITYQGQPSTTIDNLTGNPIDSFSIFKSKLRWNDANENWDPGVDHEETYENQLIADYVEDMIFIPVDGDGRIIDPPPSPANDADIFNIKVVNVLLTFRSEQDFYKTSRTRLVWSIGNNLQRHIARDDRLLRDSIVLSVNARNVSIDQ